METKTNIAANSNANSTVVDDFINQTEKIYEIEYGDFKRKIGQYILKMQRSLMAANLKPEGRQIIQEMLIKIVYNPIPDIEMARATAIDLARKLKPKIG